MYILLVVIPFISFIILSLMGRNIGRKGSIIINNILNMLLIIITLSIVYEVVYKGSNVSINIMDWLKIGSININYTLMYDSINIYLVFLIILIYTIVSTYSIWYMNEDSGLIRFMGYLNIFSLNMLILVLSYNLIILIIGWEWVGLTSYLLINYWYTRIQANKASIKAILYNKVGDIGLIIGVSMLLIYKGLYEFNNTYIIESKIINIIIIGIIIGSVAKSAQIGLHSWLGDAMEGATPVSALLHAATMVTAGIFLILRILPISIYNSYVYYTIMIIGILTVLLGGISSLYQNDIKKVIAFSTLSQLGYMYYSAGLGQYENSYYHLIIHGFFKALLFLTAGIIIHHYSNEQDFRKIKSNISNSPLTYTLMLTGTLAIISWPFYSGFYSKDQIIEYSYISNIFTYILALTGALITVIYSFRLVYGLFFKNINHRFINQSSEPFLLTHKLLLFLCIGSLYMGYILTSLFYNTLNFNTPYALSTMDVHNIPVIIKILPILISILGIIIGLNIESKKWKYINIINYFSNISWIHNIFNKKLFYDSIINDIFTIPSLSIAYNQYIKIIDKGYIEIVGPIGITRNIWINKESKGSDKLEDILKYRNYISIPIIIITLMTLILLIIW